jgi:ATP-dependent Zn protease
MQMMSGTPWETVTLTTLSRDRGVFPQLLAEARDLAMQGQEGKLVVRTAWGTEWRPFGQPRRKRPLQSVVLEEGVAENIEKDVKAFLSRREWYASRGSSEICLYFLRSRCQLVFRYPLSSWLSPLRPSGLRKKFIYTGISWCP